MDKQINIKKKNLKFLISLKYQYVFLKWKSIFLLKKSQDK